MPRGPYSRSDRDLVSRITRSPGGKAGYKQLVRELGLGGGRERRLLVEQLERLVARGELRRLKTGLWAVPRPPSDEKTKSTLPQLRPERSGRDRLVSGRLDLHRDGFGFVRPDAAGAPDIYIPAHELNGAMGGDLVLVDEFDPGREGRRSGRIARVLTRRNPTVVGIFHYAAPQKRRGRSGWLDAPTGPGQNYIQPLDERVGGIILIPDGDEIVPDQPTSQHRTIGNEAKRQGQGPRDKGQNGDASIGPWPSALGPSDGPEPWTLDPLEGLAVDVEITRFPQPGRPALGRVLEVLGHPDDFGVDVEIVIRKHHIPHQFPPAVLNDAEDQSRRTVATLSEEELARREDFRGLPIVTIDGETARDFDDAVLVRPLANGNTELQVHIADVSHYVLPASPLDTEARVRGTSVYFPDRAVPMLPHALSSGMCSLLPNEDRLVQSCIMEIDPEGEIVSYRVAEGIIRSIRRCTYTSVQQCLNASPEGQGPRAKGQGEGQGLRAKGQGISGATNPWPSTLGPWPCPPPTAEDLAERERILLEQPDLPAAFDRMLELALRLNKKRVRRGSIDFDLPEPVVEFDPDGNMKAIVRSERGWAHRLIEEFMLSANECVATWLEQQGIASIYRIHEQPDPKRILDFEETAAAFGQSLGIGALPVKRLTLKSDRRDQRRTSARGRTGRTAPTHDLPDRIPVTPQMYQRLIRRISGHPEERILSYLMLRSLKQARYAEKNEGHFALASPSYTHFTSPIRRYPDLIVHRLLRAMLHRGADPQGGPIHSADKQPWKEGQGPRAKGQADTDLGPRPSTLGPASLGPRPSTLGPASLGPRPSTLGPLAPQELADIATESSLAERRAADAERELIEWKKIKFMAARIGEDFPAMVLSVTKNGFFVELDDLFVEGLVPVASLTGDHFTFRDTDRTLCGAHTGFCFKPGQRVQVLLDRIDRTARRLQFALVPGTEPYTAASTSAPRDPRAAKKPKRSPKALKREKKSKKRR